MKNMDKKWEEQKNIIQKKNKNLQIEQSQKNTMNEIKKELILLPENDIEIKKNKTGRKIKDISNKKFGKLTVGKEYRYVKNGNSKKVEWLCTCDCGKTLWVKSHSLVLGNTDSCGCSRIKNISGQVFGKLTVTSDYRIKNNGKKSRAEWLCNCSCGKSIWVKSDSLKNGNTKSCGCFRLEKSRIGYGESSKNRVLRRYKSDAKRRGLEFNISKESFFEITSKNCSYCNKVPSNIQNDKESYGEFVYTGIDRIDNKKGYIDGNCISCCRICNMAKGEMSKEEFLTHITNIYKNLNYEKKH